MPGGNYHRHRQEKNQRAARSRETNAVDHVSLCRRKYRYDWNLPVNGFISKWYLIIGSLDVRYYLVVIVLLASALLNAAYFAPIVISAFSAKEILRVHRVQRLL